MEGCETPCLCLSTRGLCCSRCCFESRSLFSFAVQKPPPPHLCAHSLLVRWVFFLRAVANYVCLVSFFLSCPPPPPNVLLFLQLPPPLHLFLSLNVLLLLSCHLYLSEHPPHPHHPPLSAGLLMCCGGYRSAQDRWSRMISELYSFLRGTVWYCCCCLQNVLSGCLQVPSSFSLSFKRFSV